MPFAPAALDLLLPNGTTRWVALLSAEPDVVAGTYVQVGTRQPCAVWTTVAAGRANGEEIAWPEVVGDLTVAWWAIFDAAAAGSILAAGPLLNLADEPEVQIIADGDFPAFAISDLVLEFAE